MTEKTTTSPRPKLHTTSIIREIVDLLVFAVAVFVLFELAMPRSIVDGRSMEPSFVGGQRLVISRVNYWLGDPDRGDIIVFNSPQPRTEDESALVKRVIGLPGDTIEFRDTVLYINGEVWDEPYINEPCNQYRCSDELWELGADEYFMMGDNRNVSNDSRKFGPVPRENVIGEVLFRYWPLPDFGVVDHYRFPAQ